MVLRLIAAMGVLLAISHAPTFACSLPGPLVIEDPVTGIVQEVPTPQRTPEQIADSLPEVVIDGVVVERDPISGEPGATTDSFKRHARMRVDRVWKGEAAAFVTLEFGEDTAMCQQVPPVGTPIRISPDPVSPNVFSYDVLSGGAPGDPTEDAGLQLYHDRTVAMQRKAEAGGRAEKFAFADYLRRNGETHRALWMYESLLRETPDDFEYLFAISHLQLEVDRETEAMATLDHLRKLAERSEEWRGRVARFEFEATGSLTAKWKDWSSARTTKPCRILGSDFDGANFDGAVLNGCWFPRQATFRGASFRGTDLGGVIFSLDNDFRDAKYDCTTQFRKDIDPIKAGMINVKGSCPKL
jgi:hypothetical protein